MRELLEVGKVLYHQALLLARDGPAAILRQQPQDALTVFLLFGMLAFFMLGEVLL